MSEEDEPRPRRTYSSELVAHALRRAARLQVEAAEATERRSAPTSADDDPEGHGHRELEALLEQVAAQLQRDAAYRV